MTNKEKIDFIDEIHQTVCFKCGEYIDSLLYIKGENNECGDC